MKLITLNTWGGKAGLAKLLTFFKQHQDTDVFCLQEVWNGNEDMVGKVVAGQVLDNVCTTLLKEIAHVLPNHTVFFHPHFREKYGLVMLVKNTIPVLRDGEIFIYKTRGYEHESDLGNHARILQYVTLDTADGVRTIANVHGLWNGHGKGDCADRLIQSKRIVTFLKTLDHPYVLAGDFNLKPKTKSLALLEQTPMRNLIQEYAVQSTRTSYYKKPCKFADYVLVSNGIDVQNFKVLPDEVSDHAPLILTFV